jgi:nitroimidazol reductase NimA-like FMN-containing flavoprotein (pyridoxamine 5'-phosphate oxidase superfamily)
VATTEERWRAGRRTKVRRLPERGRYDRRTIEQILDEGFVCHVAFCGPDGPVLLPTGYARVGEVLYLHGASGNHMLRTLGRGTAVCVAVTLLDGLVLARSGFHHSINYRSVVVYGRAVEVRDPDEKRAALDAVVEQIVPGRTADARGPDAAELRATRVVRVAIEEASAKVRAGGPKDDEEDIERGGVWAGHVPLRLVAGAPVPDVVGPPLPPVPGYVAAYRRPGAPRPDAL